MFKRIQTAQTVYCNKGFKRVDDGRQVRGTALTAGTLTSSRCSPILGRACRFPGNTLFVRLTRSNLEKDLIVTCERMTIMMPWSKQNTILGSVLLE